MPCCASRVVSVAPIMVNAKPDEIPRKSAARGAGSRYGRSPAGSASLKDVLILDRQRRVVGEALLLVDRFLACLRRDARRRDLVVDAPADVLRPGLPAVRPPGVLVRLRVDSAEHVD